MEARTQIRRIGASEGSVVRSVRLRSLATDPSSFVSTYAREAAFAEEEWTEWAAGDASGEEKSTLLALRAAEPVGLVAAYRDEEQQSLFHVVAMWVAPEARRQGIGRRLLAEIERWIASSGGDRIHLSVADQAGPHGWGHARRPSQGARLLGLSMPICLCKKHRIVIGGALRQGLTARGQNSDLHRARIPENSAATGHIRREIVR